MLMFEEVCFLPETKKVNGLHPKNGFDRKAKKKTCFPKLGRLGSIFRGHSLSFSEFCDPQEISLVENSGKILLRISHPFQAGRAKEHQRNCCGLYKPRPGPRGKFPGGDLTRRRSTSPNAWGEGRYDIWDGGLPLKQIPKTSKNTVKTSVSEVWLVMTGFGWGSFFPWLLIYKHFCFGRYLNGQINAIIPKLVNLNCVGRHFGKIPLVNPPFGVTNCRFLVSIICGKDVGGRLEREVSSGRHALPFSSAKRR